HCRLRRADPDDGRARPRGRSTANRRLTRRDSAHRITRRREQQFVAATRWPVRLLSVTAFVSALVFASAAAAAPVPMPLISRGLPAFTSSGIYPARDANDGDYDTVWRGSSKSWLAYDLSTVPSSRRSRILVAWYNDPITTPYDYALAGDVAYNEPRDYTVQANAAHGGGAAPSSGWVTLATVTGNRYHSRQHLVDFAGYNWIRLNVSAVNGSPGNTDAAIN